MDHGEKQSGACPAISPEVLLEDLCFDAQPITIQRGADNSMLL